jgi:hypothetical protein
MILGLNYFIESGTGGPVKIGFTTDIHERLRQLQTASSEELHVLALIVDTSGMERSLHVQFKGQRLRGEWYTPNAEMIGMIQEYWAYSSPEYGDPSRARSHPYSPAGKQLSLEVDE